VWSQTHKIAGGFLGLKLVLVEKSWAFDHACNKDVLSWNRSLDFQLFVASVSKQKRCFELP